jgi:hypothetical protein
MAAPCAQSQEGDLWLNSRHESGAFATIALIGKYKSPEIAESLMLAGGAFLTSAASRCWSKRARRPGRGGRLSERLLPANIGQRADLAIVSAATARC